MASLTTQRNGKPLPMAPRARRRSMHDEGKKILTGGLKNSETKCLWKKALLDAKPVLNKYITHSFRKEQRKVMAKLNTMDKFGQTIIYLKNIVEDLEQRNALLTTENENLKQQKEELNKEKKDLDEMNDQLDDLNTQLRDMNRRKAIYFTKFKQCSGLKKYQIAKIEKEVKSKFENYYANFNEKTHVEKYYEMMIEAERGFIQPFSILNDDYIKFPIHKLPENGYYKDDDDNIYVIENDKFLRVGKTIKVEGTYKRQFKYELKCQYCDCDFIKQKTICQYYRWKRKEHLFHERYCKGRVKKNVK